MVSVHSSKTLTKTMSITEITTKIGKSHEKQLIGGKRELILQAVFDLPRYTTCLSQGFTTVNRHHDQGKSYKKPTFNWGWLTGSEVQSIIIKVGAQQYPGRHGTGRDEF